MIDWLQSHLGMSPQLQTRLLVTVGTIVGLWLVRHFVLGFVYSRVKDPWGRYRWRKGVTYALVAVGVILVSQTWFVGTSALTTYLGLVSAGLAIALKEPLSKVGGWVDADQSSGRIIHIPNGKVFSDPVANYNKGFRYIWNEVPVVVTFESDWKKAKQILGKIAVKHAEHLTAQAEQELLDASQQYLINYRKLTPIVYTSVVDYGVQLTIRYLIEPRKRRGTEHAIWEDILTEFAAAPDIDLAYHTVRSFKLSEEGKEARPARPARRAAPRPSDVHETNE